MKKWTAKELLCNSRGLDDGYVFLHKDHPLSKETHFIMGADEYTKNKFLLSDIGKISCFFGYFRKPLSHEIHSLDDDSSVPLPATSNKISRSSDVFSGPIEPNQAVCFAFTEPDIKGHISEILQGAVLPPSVLTDEDRRIRRPRLNRGGDTIANLGGSNKSHKSGYGSMNINSYERDLAIKSGRGGQLNQAGTRTWGSLEPTPKRYNSGQYSVTPQVPTMQRWQPPTSRPPPSTNFPPPPPHPSQQWPQQQNQQFSQGYNQQQQQYNMNTGVYNQQAMAAMTGIVHGQSPQQQWGGNANYPNQSIPLPQQQQNYIHQPNYGLPPNYNQPNSNQSGFAFNQQGQRYQQQQAQSHFAFNRQGMHQQQQQQQQQVQPQTGGRANLTNLRAQLMSTLQKQRKND